MEWVEVRGKSVEIAVEAALRELGIESAEQAEVEVLQEPEKGFLGIGGKCRICNQRLFVPRRCHKHAKAHHIKFVGYVLPLSVHLLLFHWFRCTYCGTAVRLKK